MPAGLADNFFKLFEFPQAFLVDDVILAERYQNLQRVVHPDRFASSGDRDRRIAMQLAAHVNEAYQTLISPVSRAIYLLGLFGIDVESVSIQDTQFLMQQMTLRENLEKIQSAGNLRYENLLQEFVASLSQSEKLLQTELEVCFDQGTDASLHEAARVVHKMQFFNRLQISAGEAK